MAAPKKRKALERRKASEKRRTREMKRKAEERKPEVQERKASLEDNAIHEARHVVAAYALGIPFTSVSIIPDREDGSEGRVMPALGEPDLRALIKFKWSVRVPELEEACITTQSLAVVALAGPVAVEVLAGHNIDQGLNIGPNELEHAKQGAKLSMRLMGFEKIPKEPIHLVMSMLERAKALLSRTTVQKAVRAVADELLERREMTYQEVVEVIQRSEQETRKTLRESGEEGHD